MLRRAGEAVEAGGEVGAFETAGAGGGPEVAAVPCRTRPDMRFPPDSLLPEHMPGPGGQLPGSGERDMSAPIAARITSAASHHAFVVRTMLDRIDQASAAEDKFTAEIGRRLTSSADRTCGSRFLAASSIARADLPSDAPGD